MLSDILGCGLFSFQACFREDGYGKGDIITYDCPDKKAKIPSFLSPGRSVRSCQVYAKFHIGDIFIVFVEVSTIVYHRPVSHCIVFYDITA